MYEGWRTNPIHLAFLFASPLILKAPLGIEVKDKTLAPISFQQEFEQILTHIEKKKIKFLYRYLVATE